MLSHDGNSQDQSLSTSYLLWLSWHRFHLRSSIDQSQLPKGGFISFDFIFLSDSDGSGSICPQYLLGHNHVRRTPGSPLSRYLCVGVHPKQFTKEISQPVAGALLTSVRLQPQVPARPLSVHERVSAPSWAYIQLWAQRSFPPATCQNKMLPTVHSFALRKYI